MLMHCINFSRTMLEKAGDFYPFGATLSPQGVVSPVGGYNGEEHPAPVEIYKLLGDAFTSATASGQYAGVALAANVNVPAEYSAPFPDGLRVHIESSGYARFIYVPYKVTQQGLLKRQRAVEFSEPFAVEIRPIFFAGADA